jgi:protein SCO1/2
MTPAAAVLVPLLLAATGPGSGPTPGPAADARPAALRDVAFDQRLGETLPLETALVDESGRAVRLGDYFGRRPVVLSLAYYGCPMLCTLSLNGLASAMKTLSFDAGREFEVVTLSFEHKETPQQAAAAKKGYLERYGRPQAAAGWHFLTGDAAAVAAVTRAVGFRYAWDEETRQYAHPTGVVVATPEGRIARYLYGVEYAPKDLRFALVEASAGRVGTPVDQLLLYCYEYDPVRGRYGAAIMRTVRFMGILTVLGLAALITILRRGERTAPAGGRAG